MPSTALQGIFRSLRLYHGDKVQANAKDQLYGKFLSLMIWHLISVPMWETVSHHSGVWAQE